MTATMTSTLTTTKLDRLIDGGLHAQASAVVRVTALLILDLAQSTCPVVTGHLKGSLQPGGDENVFDFTPGALVAIIGTNVIYAVYVEFGTSRQRGQPFLTPAVESVRPMWANAIGQLFGEGVGL